MGTLELTGRVEVSYSPEALQVAALNREATVAKRAGDWARAWLSRAILSTCRT